MTNEMEVKAQIMATLIAGMKWEFESDLQINAEKALDQANHIYNVLELETSGKDIADTPAWRPVCERCGSTDIMVDAWANYNPESGQFDQLRCSMDHTECGECAGECKTIDVPYNEEFEEAGKYPLPTLANIIPSGRTYTASDKKPFVVKDDRGVDYGVFDTLESAQKHADEMTSGKDVAIQKGWNWELLVERS